VVDFDYFVPILEYYTFLPIYLFIIIIIIIIIFIFIYLLLLLYVPPRMLQIQNESGGMFTTSHVVDPYSLT
jgi:hypothetical protein